MRFLTRKTRKQNKRAKQERAQMTIEYTVMFTVICAVIIYASINFVKPAVCRFYNSSAVILNNATTTVQCRFTA